MSSSQVPETSKVGDEKPRAETSSAVRAQEKKNWRVEEQQELPKNNLPLVYFSLLLALFLV